MGEGKATHPKSKGLGGGYAQCLESEVRMGKVLYTKSEGGRGCVCIPGDGGQ